MISPISNSYMNLFNFSKSSSPLKISSFSKTSLLHYLEILIIKIPSFSGSIS